MSLGIGSLDSAVRPLLTQNRLIRQFCFSAEVQTFEERDSSPQLQA